jgi:anti-sigma factor RsiW
MTCNEIKDLTVPYLDLDLEPVRVRDVTAHLEGCAGCRAEMETVRQILVRVKGVTVPDPGDRFWNDFPDKVHRDLARERPPIPSRLWKGMSGWPMALAASVMLLVGAWTLKGLFERGPAPVPMEQTVAQGPVTRAEQPQAAEPDLSQLVETDGHEFLDEDPDMALVEMASGLDRQTVDRLFKDI